MTAVLAAALTAGLLGSPHCVGMCGGFATAAADAPVPFHAGRFATYATLGALAGVSGAALPGPAWLTASVAVLLLLWFSARLAGFEALRLPEIPGLTRMGARFARDHSWLGRAAFGMSTGLLPCGLVWAALSMAVAAGSGAAGALTMVVFGLGTLPLLATVSMGFRGVVARHRGLRLLLAASVLGAGLWAISARVPVAGPEEPPACHTP